MSAAELIRRTRLERGMTQAGLARAAGTSQPAVARLEAGLLSPSVATVERLLKALGLRLELGATPRRIIDRTLIAQTLRLAPSQRLRKLKQERDSIERMKSAFRKAR